MEKFRLLRIFAVQLDVLSFPGKLLSVHGHLDWARTGATRFRIGDCRDSISNKYSDTTIHPLNYGIIKLRVRACARPLTYLEERAWPALSTADHAVSPPVVSIPRDYNAAHDLIERNLSAGRGDKVAFIDDQGSYTYAELGERVNRAAKRAGVAGIRDGVPGHARPSRHDRFSGGFPRRDQGRHRTDCGQHSSYDR